MQGPIFPPNFSTADIIANIVYSSLLQDYLLFFALLSIGYFTISYFMGYLIGRIPYVNKLFKLEPLLAVFIILPLLTCGLKIMFNSDSGDIFLEKYLFITILTCLSILIFIYAGTKQINNNVESFLFKAYPLSILSIVIASIFYLAVYFPKYKSNFEKEIIQDVIHLQTYNDADYRIAESVVNYYKKSTDEYKSKLYQDEQKFISYVASQQEKFDNEYLVLSKKIEQSDKTLEDLKLIHERKVKMIDKDIDEEKLRLKHVYREWENNVEHDINSLDRFTKQYANEIEALEKNKKLIVDFESNLNELNKKNTTTSDDLSNLNASIVKNSNILTAQNKDIKQLVSMQDQLNKNKKSIDFLKADLDVIKKDLEKDALHNDMNISR